LAKGVKSKLTGVAQYRFPRKVSFDYKESRDARLVLPRESWIEEETYSGGQPLAELTGELVIKAAEGGIVELLPIGADGGVINIRDEEDDENVLASSLLPAGVEISAGAGDLIEAGDDLARAAAGTTLSVPQAATARVRTSKVRGNEVTITIKVDWE